MHHVARSWLLVRHALLCVAAVVALVGGVAWPGDASAQPSPQPSAPTAAVPAPAVAVSAGPRGATVRPDSLQGTAPNIVLVVTDDQTLDSMRYMPYMQQQRDAGEVVYFTQAETNNPLCCPGRASILTGQVDTRTGVQNNSQVGNIRPTETLGPPLQDVGYRTGLFGKLLNGYNESGGVWPGWDDFQPIESRNIYAQYNYNIADNGVLEHYGAAAEDYQVDVLTGKSLDFIDQTPADQPLFLYVAPTATHTPWVPAPRHQDAYAGTPITLPANFAEADVSDKPAWIQQLPIPGRGGAISQRRKQYAAGLAVDDMMRAIDERLAATGRMDSTVVMFISDNGLSSGSNRWSSKICELRGCASIPFVVRYPGESGRTEPRLATNVDIAPTVVDLAGAVLPIRPDGISLVAALEDAGGTVSTHHGILQHWPGGDQNGSFAAEKDGTPGFYAIRTKKWRYAEVTNLAVAGNTEYELYDEVGDPGELTNLATDPAYARIRASLRDKLYAMVTATGATPGQPQGSWRPIVSPPPPADARYQLRYSNTAGDPDLDFAYGAAGDVPLACDWDGDGVDTAGVFRDGVFLLRNSNSAGKAKKTFAFGQPGDIPLCGDWNGSGVDTIGVFRAGTFYLRNSNSAGPSSITVAYGAAGDTPVAGDWNGDGIDSIGFVRASAWSLSDKNRVPKTAYQFTFGAPGDQPVVGNWTGTPSDTVGVRRGATFLLRFALAAGAPDLSVDLGEASDIGLAGDWDGQAGSTIGIARGFRP